MIFIMIPARSPLVFYYMSVRFSVCLQLLLPLEFMMLDIGTTLHLFCADLVFYPFVDLKNILYAYKSYRGQIGYRTSQESPLATIFWNYGCRLG